MEQYGYMYLRYCIVIIRNDDLQYDSDDPQYDYIVYIGYSVYMYKGYSATDFGKWSDWALQT